MGNSLCTPLGHLECESSLKEKGQTKMKIVLVGLHGVGKTTILRQLRSGDLKVSDIDIDHDEMMKTEITYKNAVFSFWEISGEGENSRPVWTQYFQGMEALVFVVDSTDRERIEEARYELLHVMCNVKIEKTAFFVWTNKQDLPGAMRGDEIKDKLKLPALNGINWHVQLCSATKNEGLFQGLDWILLHKTKTSQLLPTP